MSSVWEKDKAKRRREDARRREAEPLTLPEEKPMITADPHFIILPDNWYINAMLKRLRWPRCEDRETVISLFKQLWPAVAHRAEEFYKEALKYV